MTRQTSRSSLQFAALLLIAIFPGIALSATADKTPSPPQPCKNDPKFAWCCPAAARAARRMSA